MRNRNALPKDEFAKKGEDAVVLERDPSGTFQVDELLYIQRLQIKCKDMEFEAQAYPWS
jgi:hypothetical protein